MSERQDENRSHIAFECGRVLNRLRHHSLQAFLLYSEDMTTRVVDDLRRLANLSRELTPDFNQKEALTTFFMTAAKGFQEWRVSEDCAIESAGLEDRLNLPGDGVSVILAAAQESLDPDFSDNWQARITQLLAPTTAERGFFELGQFSDRLRRPTDDELGNLMVQRAELREPMALENIIPGIAVGERVEIVDRFRNPIDEVPAVVSRLQPEQLSQRWRELRLPMERLVESDNCSSTVALAEWIDREVQSLFSLDTPTAVSDVTADVGNSEVTGAVTTSNANNLEPLPASIEPRGPIRQSDLLRHGRWSYSDATGELSYEEVVICQLPAGAPERLFSRLFAAEPEPITFSTLRANWRAWDLGDVRRPSNGVIRNRISELRGQFRNGQPGESFRRFGVQESDSYFPAAVDGAIRLVLPAELTLPSVR